MRDIASANDLAAVGALSAGSEKGRWRCQTRIEQYNGDWTAEQIDAGLAGAPSAIEEREGNILVNAGILVMLKALTGTAITAFSNANAYIGVGDTATAPSASQTDLQAPTNKLRKAMDATYPKVGTSDGLAADNQVQFRSTFATTDAVFAWAEWGIFNASTAGTMLNRSNVSQGTKVNTATWVFSITISIS